LRFLYSSAHASRSTRSKAIPCVPMGMAQRCGRTSRLKRFLSIPRYDGASRNRMKRATAATHVACLCGVCRSALARSSAPTLSSPLPSTSKDRRADVGVRLRSALGDPLREPCLDLVFDPADGLFSDVDACREAPLGLQFVHRRLAESSRLAALGQPEIATRGCHRRPPTGPEPLPPPKLPGKRARRRRRVQACAQSRGSAIWQLLLERKTRARWT
jgi:hypothetical protein